MFLAPVIHNLTLLIALSVIHSIITQRFRQGSIRQQILSGFLFGIVVIIGMVGAFELHWPAHEGIIFDGRSIVLSVAGLFGGPVTAAVAVLISIAFRIYLAGEGLLMGILVIITSAGLGTVYHYLKKRSKKASTPLAYLSLGVAVHLAMLLFSLTLPAEVISGIFVDLLFPVLVIYPLATFLLCLIFDSREREIRLTRDLIKSEKRFREVFQNSNAIMMILDPEDGKIHDVNLAAEKFYGYPGHKLREMKISEINTLPEEEVRKHIDLVTKEEKGVFNFKHCLSGGRIRDVEVHAGPVDIGGKKMVFSIIHDITDKRLSEEELKRERQLLRTVIDSIPTTLYVKDLKLRKVLTNKEDLKMMGKNEEEVIGKTDYELFSANEARRFEEDDKKVIEQEAEVINREENFTDKDGKETWLLTSKKPFRDEDGNIIGIVGIGRDITERVISARELEKAKKTAEEANYAKSEFLANMSHEIRTPMNAILGFSEALYEQVENPSQKEMLKSVLSSGQLLLTLLNDILDLSKIEAGRMDIVPKPTDMRHLVSEMQILYEGKASKKDLDFFIEIPDDFPEAINIDEVRFKQVLFNLIGNAVKFTEKGKIEASLKFIKDGDDKGTLKLRVADTGIGIPPEYQEKIFKPFYQQSGSITRRHGGAGLGLPISKRLIERMKGRIDLESATGLGSVFTVTIPEIGIVKTREHSLHSVVKDDKSVRFKDATVLVVDDSSANRQLLEVLLSSAGLTVVTAEDGESALEVADKDKPDLIILDILMPGMDGYEVASRIKGIKGLDQTPIIAFTAYVHQEGKFQESGLFDDYLYKPVKRKDIYTTLGKYLNSQEVATESEEPDTGGELSVDEISRSDFSRESLEKLPEFVEELKSTFIPQWQGIKDHWVLFKIESFAQKLNDAAKQNDIEYLEKYSDKILEYIETFELELLKKELQHFPEIVKRLESI